MQVFSHLSQVFKVNMSLCSTIYNEVGRKRTGYPRGLQSSAAFQPKGYRQAQTKTNKQKNPFNLSHTEVCIESQNTWHPIGSNENAKTSLHTLAGQGLCESYARFVKCSESFVWWHYIRRQETSYLYWSQQCERFPLESDRCQDVFSQDIQRLVL